MTKFFAVSIPFKRESGFKPFNYESPTGGIRSFNSLQTGKWIQTPFCTPHERKKTCGGFNSLQTGKWIQTEATPSPATPGKEFQFPSNGKVDSNKEIAAGDARVESFNSLQTGKWIQTKHESCCCCCSFLVSIPFKRESGFKPTQFR